MKSPVQQLLGATAYPSTRDAQPLARVRSMNAKFPALDLVRHAGFASNPVVCTFS